MTTNDIVKFPAERVSPGLELDDPGTVLDMDEARYQKRIQELEREVAELKAELNELRAENQRLREIIKRAGLSPDVDVEMPQQVGTVDPLGEG